MTFYLCEILLKETFHFSAASFAVILIASPTFRFCEIYYRYYISFSRKMQYTDSPKQRFHFLRHFPQCNIYISHCFGKAMCAERKMLSLESIRLSKKAEGDKDYEEQQPDQCSPGS